MKSIIKQLVGEKLVGGLDYFRFPQYKSSWGGPFNGQQSRRKLFLSLMERLKPEVIVETGTYRGTTTEFMASSGIQVVSIEGHARNYGYAAMRLKKLRNVRVFLGDSREVLKRLFENELAGLVSGTIFVYLDAHWNSDLPLEGEINLVFEACPNAVVMIDDFEVPSDPGYTFDDYGEGSALVYSYIAPAVARHRLRVFYPSGPSAEETGLKRGAVVLSKEVHAASLSAEPLLREM